MAGMIQSWIRPLSLLKAEKFFQKMQAIEVDSEDVLQFVSQLGGSTSLEGYVARYHEITQVEDNKLQIVPGFARIFYGVIPPLREAKGCYVLENYLATVALCGAIAERVAIILFEISNDAKKSISVESFEKKQQFDREKLLFEMELINSIEQSYFAEIRGIRKKYLHYLTISDLELPGDAKQIYARTVHVVNMTIGSLGFRNGQTLFREDLIEYLKRKGSYHENEDA